MRSATASTPRSATHRGRSLLADLLVMALTGVSIALFAQAGANSLASLGAFTAIAVLVGTITLQLLHHLLARHIRQADNKHRARNPAQHKHADAHLGRRGKSPAGTPPRSGPVRFSGRS